MSSQGRSAGAVFCIVLAMLSMATAVILSAVALTATSEVADEPLGEFGSKMNLFEDPDCETKAETPPDQLFMKCFSEYQSAIQEDAALWEREIEARQTDIQAKGNLAIIFGLLGVTFAVCAVVCRRDGRTEPQPTGTWATQPAPGGADGSTEPNPHS